MARLRGNARHSIFPGWLLSLSAIVDRISINVASDSNGGEEQEDCPPQVDTMRVREAYPRVLWK